MISKISSNASPPMEPR